MNQNKTAEEKVKCILEQIKEQYDLGPKGSYSVNAGMGYGFRYPAGEIRLDTQRLLSAGGVDYFELEKILAKLQEDGLIEKFSTVSDFA